jgi:hypothetical protein
VVDLEGDITGLDDALGGADHLARSLDLDERGLVDVVLVALDGDEVAVRKDHDVVREGRDGGAGQAGAQRGQTAHGQQAGHGQCDAAASSSP